MKTTFNAATSDLPPGTWLLEASAGTGKTYTLTLLVLRLLLEHKLSLKQILVVTFTKTATAELKQRLHQRLQQALSILQTPADPNDDEVDANVLTLLRPWQSTPSLCLEAQQRLQLALAELGQAPIATIHSFCQQALQQHALASGQGLNVTLQADLTAVQQSLIQDYWRHTIYGQSPALVQPLVDKHANPDQLFQHLHKLSVNPWVNVEPSIQPWAAVVDAYQQAMNQIQTYWQQIKSDLLPQVGELLQQDPTPLHKNQQRQLQAAWHRVLVEQRPYLTDEHGILLNPQAYKLKKNHQLPETINELLDHGLPCMAELKKRLVLQWQLNGLQWLQQHSQRQADDEQIWSFDQVIHRLAQGLADETDSPSAPDQSLHQPLHQALQQRYTAALVDEFQDTDEMQWFIFQSLFHQTQPKHHWLFLIGDPKQAIYRFRGANLHTYYAARSVVHHHASLNTNYRSHPQLVTLLNQLFAPAHADETVQPFADPHLTYTPVQAGKSEADVPRLHWQPSDALKAHAQNTQMSHSDGVSALCQIQVPDAWCDSAAQVQQQLPTLVAHWIGDVLQSGQWHQANQAPQPVTTKDMAILVNSHDNARLLQRQLAIHGINGILARNKNSIFAQPEAKVLQQWLQTLLAPGRQRQLRRWLAHPWIMASAEAFYHNVQHANQLEYWFHGLQQAQHLWQRRGIFVAIQWLCRQPMPDGLTIENRLSQQPNGARALTNWWQLLELLQQAANEQRLSPTQQAHWLDEQIQTDHNDDAPTEERTLRLDQDGDGITIITSHSSKGLEYPIVWCPYLWINPTSRLKGAPMELDANTGFRTLDMGSEHYDRRKQDTLDDQKAESHRLAYVALTRAQSQCFFFWAPVAKSRAKINPIANQSPLGRWLGRWSDGHPSVLPWSAWRVSDQWVASSPIARVSTATQASHAHWPELNTTAIAHAKYTRVFHSSYSALVNASPSHAPSSSVAHTTVAPSPFDALPKGAALGSLVHDVLEQQTFQDLSKGQLDWALCQRIHHRVGSPLEPLQPEQPSELWLLFRDWLQALVNQPLVLSADISITLADLPPQNLLKEMPFTLHVPHLHLNRLNQWLSQRPDASAIDAPQLEGYLSGFMDLIFEHQGQYWLLDYKTNALPHYDEAQLQQAMQQHGYGLQMAIYALALHLFCQQRVANYDFDQHFGGVLYHFVRGVDVADDHQHTSNLYVAPLGWTDLHQFAQAFDIHLHPMEADS